MSDTTPTMTDLGDALHRVLENVDLEDEVVEAISRAIWGPGSKNFTNGEPFVVTQEDMDLRWGGYRDGRKFCCGMCHVRFRPGDTIRWQYVTSGPNIFVCTNDDTPDLIERWAEKWAAYREMDRIHGDH